MGDETFYPTDEMIVRAGVAAIIFNGESLCMIKRKGSHGAGMWSVPGGWMKFGEDPQTAAKRETMEEVGITVRPLRYLHTTSWPFWKDQVHSVCMWWLCQPVGKDPFDIRNMEPDKIETLDWIPYREVEDGSIEGAPLFPHLQLFIEEFQPAIPVPGLRAVHEMLRRRMW